ncbi:tyrosine protein phosphatase [Priestia megaterium]|nr:tyrosine protein phosphatase [Priestia megaterium]
MIDIYTYMMPKTSGSTKEFQEAAKFLTDQGVKVVMAAPHETDYSPVSMYVDEANRVLESQVIPLKVVSGKRVMVNERFIQTANRSFLTINDTNKYMLLGVPQKDKPTYLEHIVYELQLDGIVPIISEPERHPYFLENKDELYQLVKQGAIVQLASDSIVGANGKKEKKAAFQFIEHQLAHVIASGVSIDTYRHYSLDKAYEVIVKAYSQEKAKMFMQNAKAIVEGEGIQMLPPERVKKSKFLGLF